MPSNEHSSINPPYPPGVSEAAQAFLAKGYAPIPVPRGEKNPNRKDWQKERYTPETAARAFHEGVNIGLLCGEPSGGLYDVDCDTSEAIKAAPFFLPATGMRHGRPGKPHSHLWFLCPEADARTVGYNEPPAKKGEKGARLVELRGTGGQTIVPPSVHPSGERYTWESTGEPATYPYEDLHRAVSHLAACALLARAWPGSGTRDETALALSGALVRSGWAPHDAGRFVQTVARVAGDEEWESRDKAAASQRAQHEGRNTTGWPRLAELLINGEQVVKTVKAWLGVRQGSIFDEQPGAQQPPRKPRTGAPDRPEDAGEDEILNTDAGNARRLVALFGADIRYCAEWKSWLVWTGKQWQRDTGELRLMRMAKQTVQALYREAKTWVDKLADERPPELVGEEADKAVNFARKATGLLKWAISSESSSRLHAMIGLAQDEAGIPIPPEAFEQHPYLFNVRNGTIDLHSGELRGHSREDYLTILIDLDYNPQAACPRWEQFLGEVLATPETVAFIKRAVGYSLTGETYEQVFFFMGGKGGNGKSTLQNTLLKLLGQYGHKASIETFMETQHARSGSNASPDLAELPGKRLVSPGEVRQGHKLNEQFVKDLVGADPQAARQIYERQFSFIPQCKLWMYGNYDPRITGRDYGIWRRFHYIPFKSKFTANPGEGEKKKDDLLPKKLEQELPGILAWAVQGCLEWQQSGLGISEEVNEATKEYSERQDSLAPFLTDRCIIASHAKAKKSALWKAYQEWLEENAESSKFDTSHALSRELKARGFKDDIKIGGVRFWNGIGLVDDTVPPPPKEDPQSGATSDEAPPDQDTAGADVKNGATWGSQSQEVPKSSPTRRDFPSKVAPIAPVAPNVTIEELVDYPPVGVPPDLRNSAPTNGNTARQPAESPEPINFEEAKKRSNPRTPALTPERLHQIDLYTGADWFRADSPDPAYLQALRWACGKYPDAVDVWAIPAVIEAFKDNSQVGALGWADKHQQRYPLTAKGFTKELRLAYLTGNQETLATMARGLGIAKSVKGPVS